MSWLSIAIAVLLLGGVAFVAALWFAARSRNMHIWLRSYYSRPARPKVAGPVHVMFCFVDHFEPMWGRADADTQRKRVDRWCRDYRAMAGRHRDADGRPSAARLLLSRGGIRRGIPRARSLRCARTASAKSRSTCITTTTRPRISATAMRRFCNTSARQARRAVARSAHGRIELRVHPRQLVRWTTRGRTAAGAASTTS